MIPYLQSCKLRKYNLWNIHSVLYQNAEHKYVSKWRRTQTLNPNSIINFTQKILLKCEIIIMCDPKAGKIAE